MATFNVSTGADQSLTIHIIIDDKGATRALKNVDNSLGKTGRTARTATRRFGAFRSMIATMTKALISMFAVLLVFNALITLPQAIFSGLIAIIQATIKTLADFETQILSLQAIFATTLIFATDKLQNFEKAGGFAVGVVEALTLRAAELVVNTQEALIVMQTMLAVGASKLVPTFNDLVDLTVLLANSIAGITAGQDRQRQLAEETRSLMTGQFRVTSMLARLLFRSKRDWEKFNEEAKATNNFVGMMTEKLEGFSVAALRLGVTFEGLKTTAQSFLQLFARRAFKGMFDDARMMVEDLFMIIREDVAQFDATAASVGASVRVIFGIISKWLKNDFGIAFDDAKNLMEGIEKGAPKWVGTLIKWMHKFKTVLKLVKSVFDAITVVAMAVWSIIQMWMGALRLILVGLKLIKSEKTFKELRKDLTDSFYAYDEWVNKVNGALDAYHEIFDLLDSNAEGQKAAAQAEAQILVTTEEIVQQKKESANLDEKTLGFREVSLQLALEEAGIQRKIGQSLRSQLTSQLALMKARTSMVIPARELVTAKLGGQRPTMPPPAPVTLEGTLERMKKELKDVDAQILKLQQRKWDASQVSDVNDEISKVLDQMEILTEFDYYELEDLMITLDKLRSDQIYLDLYNEEELERLEQELIQLETLATGMQMDIAKVNHEILTMFDATFSTLGDKLKNVFMAPIFKAFFKDLSESLRTGDADFKGFHGSVSGAFEEISKFVKTAEFQAMAVTAVSGALADMFKGIGEGSKSAQESMTEFFASILGGLGEMAIQMGTLWMLEGLLALDFRAVGLGLALIAAGGVAVALAAKYGAKGQGGGAPAGSGGTGEVAQFSFDQAAINVQQSASDLSTAAADLSTATSTLESMSAGDVLVKGSEQKGLTNLVARDAKKSRSFTATRNLSLTLAGR